MQALSYVLTLVLLLLITACDRLSSAGEQAQAADSTIVVTGTITGWDSGWVYVTVREQSMKERRDSVLLQQGVFTYRHAAPDATFYSFQQGQTAFTAFLDPGIITIRGDEKALADIRVTGSPSYEEARPLVQNLNEREAMYNRYFTFRDSVTTAGFYKQYQDSLNMAYAKAVNGYLTDYKSFVTKKPNSKAVIGFFFDYYPVIDSLPVIRQLYDSFGPDARESLYGKAIASRLRQAERIQIGQPAPLFSQKSSSGQLVSLSDYRGKYVLLDFWASWCRPCREENPALVAAYNQFKSRNFTVLGISLDSNRDAWLKAVRRDNLSWTQVSDLKWFYNEVAVQYVVESIPANFLIDPTGKIIARNLRGESLLKKLDETLQ